MSMLPDQSAACTHSAILKQLVVVLSDPRRKKFKHVLRLCTATAPSTAGISRVCTTIVPHCGLRAGLTMSGYLNRRRRPIR